MRDDSSGRVGRFLREEAERLAANRKREATASLLVPPSLTDMIINEAQVKGTAEGNAEAKQAELTANSEFARHYDVDYLPLPPATF